MGLLKHQLTVKNGAYWAAVQNNRSTTAAPELYLWQESEQYVWVPRNYEPPWTRPHRKAVAAKTQAGPRFEISFVGDLRRDTDMQAKAAAAQMEPGKDKILALACGAGKTVVSLYSLAKRGPSGLPAAVVVHTNDLADQWEERIREFWGIPADQIGRVQQDTIEWQDKPITIIMLQTLVKKYDRMPKEFFEYFRVVVFDEIHHLGADYFSKACTLFTGERWGLSATLQRDDGMDKVIQLHCGKVAYEHLKQPLKPQTYFIRTGISVRENRYRMRSGRTNLARLTTDLSLMKERNQLILKWINMMAAKGRKILVLGERTQQLCDLFDGVKWDSKAICTGSVSSRDGSRKKALEADVILATQHLAKEGLDQKRLDTLFIMQPFSGAGRLRQSFGRILRTIEGVNKKPKVLIFQDDIGIMGVMCGKMKNAMYKLGFDYKEVRT